MRVSTERTKKVVSMGLTQAKEGTREEAQLSGRNLMTPVRSEDLVVI